MRGGGRDLFDFLLLFMVGYTVHWVAPQGWGTADLGPVWVRQRKKPLLLFTIQLKVFS